MLKFTNIALVAALGLGVAACGNNPTDRALTGVTVVLRGTPSFLMAVLLIEVWLEYRADIVRFAQTRAGIQRWIYKALTLGSENVSPASRRIDGQLWEVQLDGSSTRAPPRAPRRFCVAVTRRRVRRLRDCGYRLRSRRF